MIYLFTEKTTPLTEQMRNVRNQLLSQSDWTMAIDASTDKFLWSVYRQSLRDFPTTWEPAETADFPEAPA